MVAGGLGWSLCRIPEVRTLAGVYSKRSIRHSFLRIMADDTCDVSTTEQMAVAIKYLTANNGDRLSVNLVVVNSCKKVPEVRNFMDVFRELSFFF